MSGVTKKAFKYIRLSIENANLPSLGDFSGRKVLTSMSNKPQLFLFVLFTEYCMVH